VNALFKQEDRFLHNSAEGMAARLISRRDNFDHRNHAIVAHVANGDAGLLAVIKVQLGLSNEMGIGAGMMLCGCLARLRSSIQA
jgi:hypothetical protein